MAVLLVPRIVSAAPVIDAPASLNFGPVVVAQSSGLSLTIGNTGNNNLNVNSITVSGAYFSASPPVTPFTIVSGNIVTFTVTFAPMARGPRSGTVTIASNDPVTPSKVVSLSGSGVAPVISTPASQAFGNVSVNSNADLNLVITNSSTDGGQILNVTGISLTGADASMFSYTPPVTTTIPPNNGTGTWVMHFLPTSSGSKSATATISSTDPLTPSKTVTLTGTGTMPALSTSPASMPPFGEVHVATTSDQTVIITNAGNAALTLTSLAFTGPDAGSFSVYAPPALPVNLGPSAQVSITVRFAPATLGAKSATFQIASNDPVTPTKSLTLSGNSVRPEPVIAGVRDIPNDQGGKLKLSWDASSYDTQASPTVDHYWILRSVPPNHVASLSVRDIGSARIDGDRYYTSRFRTNTYYWELLAEVQALHFVAGYSYVAPTTSDSLPGSNPYTLFMIMALNAGNTLHWDSAPDSGYSIDNVGPTVPASLTGEYSGDAMHLHWDRNPETDLAGYRLYRGTSSSFTPGPSNLVGSPPDTGFTDVGASGGYYKLSAVDVHDNESGFALLSPVSTADAPHGPWALTFARPAPNPARGEVVLGFTLPDAGPVDLAVFDGQGRRVCSLIHGLRPAGPQDTRWLGRDDHGQTVPDGIYFARLDAGGRPKTIRFALLR
jgi:hypothetical protein